ncbi:MAG: hypothetical protein AB7E55_11320 [Pigmentiphaga sp.]
MTRPSDIKPREGSSPGTTYAQFEEGKQLGPVEFTITPEIVDEYFDAVGADRDLYKIDGRQAAPPNVILPYMTVPIYQTYPPIQGIVMAELDLSIHHPIWADEYTSMRATGRVLKKFEKRGRRYVQWEAEFSSGDGVRIASFINTFHVPE